MTRKQLTVGSKVMCKYFNTPENRFYGDLWPGVVLEIDQDQEKPYLVQKESGYKVRLHRKELRFVI